VIVAYCLAHDLPLLRGFSHHQCDATRNTPKEVLDGFRGFHEIGTVVPTRLESALRRIGYRRRSLHGDARHRDGCSPTAAVGPTGIASIGLSSRQPTPGARLCRLAVPRLRPMDPQTLARAPAPAFAAVDDKVRIDMVRCNGAATTAATPGCPLPGHHDHQCAGDQLDDTRIDCPLSHRPSAAPGAGFLSVVATGPFGCGRV
jgi:hypothetical protein